MRPRSAPALAVASLGRHEAPRALAQAPMVLIRRRFSFLQLLLIFFSFFTVRCGS